MTVLEHPREADRATESRVPGAIFPEARRRERRRKAFSALAVLATVGALSGVAIVVLQAAQAVPRSAEARLTPGALSKPTPVPPPLVAWGDYAGVIHVGDVATRRQMQLGTYSVAQSSSWVPAAINHGRLLWVDKAGRIRSLEIATGRASVIARGTGVMSSPNGDRLYVDQGNAAFLVLDARDLKVIKRVSIPAGWTATPWSALTLAGGLILMHTGRAEVLGYWRPGDKVERLGPSVSLAGVSATPSSRYRLVAWEPRCTEYASFDAHCPLAITNIATKKTLTIPSPTRYGFTGGAFSPDGTQFATFVNTDNPSDSFSTPRSELAIIDTMTGALRLDRKVNLVTTEDAAWATWIPSGRQLLTGAISATYLVNSRSLATRPFYFDDGETRSYSVMGSSDLNFSTIAVPRSALSPSQQRSLDLAKGARAPG